MLDKEVAEERAEIAESELEDLKERLAIAEVELEVIKEGGEDGEGGESNAKSSLAYIQLEKQNERLKDALLRSVGCSMWFDTSADSWSAIGFVT